MQMLDGFHAARCSAGSRSSSRTITWLRDMQMVAWAWDKQEGCQCSTLLFIYFPPSKLKRNAKSFSAACMTGSLSWRETALQNPESASGRSLYGSWKNTTTVWQCDGWKHTGPARRWKKRNLSAVPYAENGENVPACTFGKKRHDATQETFYWLKHSDLWHKRSRMFSTSAWWNFSWKRKRKINQMPINTVNQYPPPPVGLLDITLPESSKHHHAPFLCSVACLFQRVSW